MTDTQSPSTTPQTPPAAPCPYCRKPILTPFPRTIFGRGRVNGRAVVTQTGMTFCSATCASNEQMSREG